MLRRLRYNLACSRGLACLSMSMLLFLVGPSFASVFVDADSIVRLLAGNTAECRKEKDQSTCVTFFSSHGKVVQRHEGETVKSEGRWFTDDSDRLCILWEGRVRPLCFTVRHVHGGHYHLKRNERHISSVTAVLPGNPHGL